MSQYDILGLLEEDDNLSLAMNSNKRNNFNPFRLAKIDFRNEIAKIKADEQGCFEDSLDKPILDLSDEQALLSIKAHKESINCIQLMD